MKRVIYLAAVDLNMTAADIKGRAIADGYNVNAVKPADQDASISSGNIRFWNHDKLDIWLVEIQ